MTFPKYSPEMLFEWNVTSPNLYASLCYSDLTNSATQYCSVNWVPICAWTENLSLIFHFPHFKRPRQNRWFFERAQQWQVETKDTHWKGLWSYFKRRHDAQDDKEGRSQDSSSTAGLEINQDSLAQIKGLSEWFLPFLPFSGCTTWLVGS